MVRSDSFGQPAETPPPQRPLLLLTTGWRLAAANVAAKLPTDSAVLTAALTQEGEHSHHCTDRCGGGATDSRRGRANRLTAADTRPSAFTPSHTSDLRVDPYFLVFRDRNHTFKTSKELRTIGGGVGGGAD